MAGYNTDSSAMKGAGRGGLIETEKLHSEIETLRATNLAARKELEQLQIHLEETSVWTEYSQQLWHRMDAILTTLKGGA